jgi:hypothetical protein
LGYAVLGDWVNGARRREELTRSLAVGTAASDAPATANRDKADEKVKTLLSDLDHAGP